MADDFAEVFQEVTSSTVSLSDLHPRRLDRWWTTLVGAPDAIYMQLGSAAIFHQVDQAAAAIKHMTQLLGAKNLPVAPQELAQRHIRVFSWHVSSDALESGTYVFQATWDQETLAWKLSCSAAKSTVKSVTDLPQAVEKADEWAQSLEAELRENTEES